MQEALKNESWDTIIHIHNHVKGLGIKNLGTKNVEQWP